MTFYADKNFSVAKKSFFIHFTSKNVQDKIFCLGQNMSCPAQKVFVLDKNNLVWPEGWGIRLTLHLTGVVGATYLDFFPELQLFQYIQIKLKLKVQYVPTPVVSASPQMAGKDSVNEYKYLIILL